MTDVILPALLVVLAGILIGILSSGYVKAPPDKAFIISGLRKNPKILIGRAGIKIPFLERTDTLIVKQCSIDIKTGGYIPTKDFIGVDIDAIAKVRVMTDEIVTVKAADGSDKQVRGIDLAAKNFLNMTEDQICEALTDSLQGNMREIVGTVDLKELCNDRKSFGDQVQDKAQKDMNALGIEIISCNIQKITDEQNLITALGQDNMSQIKKNASIARANAEKDVAIAEAEAKKVSNDAKVRAETEIAEKNNELEIKKAELKKVAEAKRAEAEAAFEIQNQIQQKAIQTETVNAQIAKAERDSELKKKEVAIKEQELAATVEKTADAEKYKAEKNAEAELIKRQRQAEAELFEQQKKAEAARVEAEAKKFAAEQEASAIKARYIAEAEGIAAKGRAEAEAAKARGIAEAEAMEKKAEAYKKYNGAAMAEMFIKVLPQMVEAAAKPIESIDNLNIYAAGGDSDSGNPVKGVTGITPVVIKEVMDMMKNTTGVDLSDIMKAQTYDAKVTKNVNFTGLPENTAAPAVAVAATETAVQDADVETE